MAAEKRKLSGVGDEKEREVKRPKPVEEMDGMRQEIQELEQALRQKQQKLAEYKREFVLKNKKILKDMGSPSCPVEEFWYECLPPILLGDKVKVPETVSELEFLTALRGEANRRKNASVMAHNAFLKPNLELLLRMIAKTVCVDNKNVRLFHVKAFLDCFGRGPVVQRLKVIYNSLVSTSQSKAKVKSWFFGSINEVEANKILHQAKYDRACLIRVNYQKPGTLLLSYIVWPKSNQMHSGKQPMQSAAKTIERIEIQWNIAEGCFTAIAHHPTERNLPKFLGNYGTIAGLLDYLLTARNGIISKGSLASPFAQQFVAEANGGAPIPPGHPGLSAELAGRGLFPAVQVRSNRPQASAQDMGPSVVAVDIDELGSDDDFPELS